MRKNVLSLSISAMIGGLGFAGAASIDHPWTFGLKPTPWWSGVCANELRARGAPVGKYEIYGLAPFYFVDRPIQLRLRARVDLRGRK